MNVAPAPRVSNSTRLSTSVAVYAQGSATHRPTVTNNRPVTTTAIPTANATFTASCPASAPPTPGTT